MNKISSVLQPAVNAPMQQSSSSVKDTWGESTLKQQNNRAITMIL